MLTLHASRSDQSFTLVDLGKRNKQESQSGEGSPLHFTASVAVNFVRKGGWLAARLGEPVELPLLPVHALVERATKETTLSVIGHSGPDIRRSATIYAAHGKHANLSRCASLP